MTDREYWFSQLVGVVVSAAFFALFLGVISWWEWDAFAVGAGLGLIVGVTRTITQTWIN